MWFGPDFNPPKWPSGAPSALSVNLSKKCAFSLILKKGQKSRWLSVNLLKNEEKSRGAISGTGPPLTKKNFRKFPKMSGNFPEISRKFCRKYPRPSSVILSATFSTSANLGGFSGKIFGNFDKNLKIPGFLIIFGRFFDPFCTFVKCKSAHLGGQNRVQIAFLGSQPFFSKK